MVLLRLKEICRQSLLISLFTNISENSTDLSAKFQTSFVVVCREEERIGVGFDSHVTLANSKDEYMALETPTSSSHVLTHPHDDAASESQVKEIRQIFGEELFELTCGFQSKSFFILVQNPEEKVYAVILLEGTEIEFRKHESKNFQKIFIKKTYRKRIVQNYS